MYPVEGRKLPVVLFPRDNSELLPVTEHFYKGDFCCATCFFHLTIGLKSPFPSGLETSFVITAWSSVVCMCRVYLTSFQISAVASPAAVNGLCPCLFVSFFW